jgi:flagellar protein FlaJ
MKMAQRKQETSPLDLLADLFKPVYDRIFGEESGLIEQLRLDLKRARMQTPAEVYMSRVMGVGLLIGISVSVATVLVGYALVATGVFELGPILLTDVPRNIVTDFVISNKELLIVIMLSPVLGFLGCLTAILPAIFYPKLQKSGRQREIERLMPDLISYMFALSVGGLNQIEIIEKVAEADDTYGEISQEFRSIMLETRYLESDYRSAIKNQIEVTPSPEFAQFLSDMLSILDSGGDMQSFLKDKEHKHIRLAKQHQKRGLETLELLGEIYMTVSLFPILLIILLVIMSMMGDNTTPRLFGVVYGLIPMTGVAFLVLLSTVKQDEVGDGELDHPKGSATYSTTTLTSFPIVSRYAGKSQLLSKAKRKEQTFQTITILKKPHVFFREHPNYTLFVTVPAIIAVLVASFQSGAVPTDYETFKNNYLLGTAVYLYLPMYVIFLPLAAFSLWKKSQVGSVTGKLSDTLRKLSSANDAGQPLLKSIDTVTDSSSGKLTTELTMIRSKVLYGARMKEALIEFNNKYKIPRLSRIIKLISDAQETSEDITEVLTTAASTSENQDDIRREQKSKVRMQLVIIIVTYVILLGVMALLKSQFIEVMGELANQASSAGAGSGAAPAGAGAGSGADSGGGGQFGTNVDVGLLSMMFFHAVTFQAIISGFLGGYMRSGDLKSGIKYVIPLSTLALIVWVFVA